MSISDTIPGMDSGRIVQNLLVAAVYLISLTVVLPVAAISYRPFRGC